MTTTTYEYLQADGCRFKVVRTDNADGSKRFAQFHVGDNGEWEAKAPPWKRPVWQEIQLDLMEDGAAVLVVEGEKAAIAAQRLFRGRLFVTTWAGHANAVKGTNWEVLKRFRVAVWPDLDRKTLPDGHNAGELMPFMMQPGTIRQRCRSRA